MISKKISNNIVKLMLLLLFNLYLIISVSSCSREVSVTQPDTPPPNGFIYLDSNPKGFQIYVNNKERGRITPDSLTWLATGTYYITLKKDLFKDSSFAVNAVDGQRISILVDYAKNASMLGGIMCSSKPDNAEIFLNGSRTGYSTPYTLKYILPGNYYVRFHKPNFRDDSVLVAVSSLSYSSAYKFLIDTTIWQDYTPSNSSIPSGDLTCVTVDKNNIIYAGSTANGFFSFDGTNFKTYYNSLSNQINCSAIDNNNNILLFGTPRGFVTFGAVQHEYGFMSSGLTDFRVQTISIDKESNWYIGTQGGLTEVYQPSGAMNWINYNSQYIVTSAVDNSNNVWIGVLTYGVEKKDTLNKWQLYTISNSTLQSNNVTAVAAGPTGEVWIGYGIDNNFGHGLTCINGSSWNNYNVLPSYSKVTTIFIDSKNVKWVGTNQGLVMFTTPTSYTLYNYDNTGLNINGVTGISEDSYGNIWISTNTGLYEYKGNH